MKTKVTTKRLELELGDHRIHITKVGKAHFMAFHHTKIGDCRILDPMCANWKDMIQFARSFLLQVNKEN